MSSDSPRELTCLMLNETVKELLDKFHIEGWNPTIKVHGFPRPFTPDVLKKILFEANKIAFNLMSTATGVSYVYGHINVMESDGAAAINITKVAIKDNILPEESNWEYSS